MLQLQPVTAPAPKGLPTLLYLPPAAVQA
jgi:hypothetical protein